MKTIFSPFLSKRNTTQWVMLQVLLALVPAFLVKVYFFGVGVLVQFALALATALFFEALCLRLRKRKALPALSDFSATLTAALLALAMPALGVWWLIVLATAFAIVIGKHLFGGLGQNPFNLAMLGFALVILSYPADMARWPTPDTVLPAIQQIAWIFTSQLDALGKLPLDMVTRATPLDGIASATPLDLTKTALRLETQHATLPWLPNMQGLNLTASYALAGAYLVGGLFMWRRKLIKHHTALSMLTGITLISGALWLYNDTLFSSPMFHWLSGATLIGAFFIVTDPVTSPTTIKGQWIYGLLIGIFTYVIRVFGNFPDGLAFAVLIMNIATPLIDQYTQPKVFGRKDEP